jgi:hypothetical protein
MIKQPAGTWPYGIFGGHTQSAASTLGDSISADEMVESMRKAMASIPPVNDEWLLVSPHGQAFKGPAASLLLLLMREHPLLKEPLRYDFAET